MVTIQYVTCVIEQSRVGKGLELGLAMWPELCTPNI